jgi:HlyD family secretion protein
MPRQLFRQAALDRLSSPEELDRTVSVANPLGWLMLGTLMTMLAAVIAWGLYGSIPDQVDGEGIIVANGGRVLDAMSPAQGAVVSLAVAPNSAVKRGDEIAIIRQDSLRQDLVNARAILRERENEKSVAVTSHTEELAVRQRNIERQREAQEAIIAAAMARADALADELRNIEELASKGFATAGQIDAKRAAYNAAVLDASTARGRLLDLEADLQAFQAAHMRETAALTLRIAEAQNRIRELEVRLQNDTRVLAPVDGTVTEIKVFEGAVIAKGAPVASIAIDGAALQAVIFVPTEDGKRVRPGMQAHISPSTIKKEEHGAIIGRIVSVGDYPATEEGMLAVLQNERLVRAYSAAGAPYAVRVDLETDQSTSSGFRWTSGSGPTDLITAGTTLTAEVTVSEQPPINLIIPFVRRHTGIGFLPDVPDWTF